MIPKDFSAISDRGQVTLSISAWTFTANELHPALQFDCVSVFVCTQDIPPVQGTVAVPSVYVVNCNLYIVAEYQSTTIA